MAVDPVSRLLWGALGLLSALSRSRPLPQGRAARRLIAAVEGPNQALLPLSVVTRALEEAAREERLACVAYVEAAAQAARRGGAVEVGLELKAVAYELKVGARRTRPGAYEPQN
jgi:hypothetical protein